MVERKINKTKTEMPQLWNEIENYMCLNVIDTQREREIYLGVNYDYPSLKEDECMVPDNLLKKLKADKGDTIKLDIVIYNLYHYLLKMYNQEVTSKG